MQYIYIQSHLRRHGVTEHEKVLKGANTNYVSERASHPGMKYGGPGYGGGEGGSMKKYGGEKRMKKGPYYNGGGEGGPDGYRNNQGMLCPYCVEYVCSYLSYHTSNLISILLYSIISGFKHQKTHHHHYYDYDDGEDGEDEGYDGGGGGGGEGMQCWCPDCDGPAYACKNCPCDGENHHHGSGGHGGHGRGGHGGNGGGGVCGNPFVSAPDCDYFCQGGSPVCKNDDEEDSADYDEDEDEDEDEDSADYEEDASVDQFYAEE